MSWWPEKVHLRCQSSCSSLWLTARDGKVPKHLAVFVSLCSTPNKAPSVPSTWALLVAAQEALWCDSQACTAPVRWVARWAQVWALFLAEGRWESRGRAQPGPARQPPAALASGGTDPAAARGDRAREGGDRARPGDQRSQPCRARPCAACTALPAGPGRRAALQTGLDSGAAMLQVRCGWATSSDSAVCWNTTSLL